MRTDLERRSAEYEAAEAEFLAAIRDHTARAQLATKARTVAEAAEAFNTEAYRQLHTGRDDAWMPLSDLTERTEVLEDLWSDLASAYEE